MRLIDADTLLEELKKTGRYFQSKFDIENAPTVELTEEQAIDKLHETGWLPRHDKEMTERPQGEWLDIDSLVSKAICSKCQKPTITEPFGKPNYCPNCGADMRGNNE